MDIWRVQRAPHVPRSSRLYDGSTCFCILAPCSYPFSILSCLEVSDFGPCWGINHSLSLSDWLYSAYFKLWNRQLRCHENASNPKKLSETLKPNLSHTPHNSRNEVCINSIVKDLDNENVFLSKCERLGRRIDSPMASFAWRWSGYHFGVDLLFRYSERYNLKLFMLNNWCFSGQPSKKLNFFGIFVFKIGLSTLFASQIRMFPREWCAPLRGIVLRSALQYCA